RGVSFMKRNRSGDSSGPYHMAKKPRGFRGAMASWLQRMVRERIADPVILSLVGKWLRAGAMHNGVMIRAEEGTPQGGPISCVLANIYLHYALDLWFERKFRRQCRGETYLVRFVDDFVVSFQHLADAEAFRGQLHDATNNVIWGRCFRA